MKLAIQSKEENQLLGRTEVRGSVSFAGATPRRYEVLAQVAAALKVKPELLVVRKLETAYGGGRAEFLAFAYEDPKVFEKVERAYMRKRNEKPAAPEKKEEAPAPAPAPAEEKPAEEKAADAPAEEKPAEEKPAEPAKEEAKAEEKPTEAPAEEKAEEKPAEKAAEDKPAEKAEKKE